MIDIDGLPRRKCRVDGRSLEERVWAWMRVRGGPVKLREIRLAFNLDKHSASSCVRRMLKKESVIASGATHTLVYTATEFRPEDKRGKDSHRNNRNPFLLLEQAMRVAA